MLKYVAAGFSMRLVLSLYPEEGLFWLAVCEFRPCLFLLLPTGLTCSGYCHRILLHWDAYMAGCSWVFAWILTDAYTVLMRVLTDT